MKSSETELANSDHLEYDVLCSFVRVQHEHDRNSQPFTDTRYCSHGMNDVIGRIFIPARSTSRRCVLALVVRIPFSLSLDMKSNKIGRYE